LQAQITLARQQQNDFVIQERLYGQEYTVLMAADRRGLLRAIVPVLVERKRGITLRAITKRDNEVIEACRLIHNTDPVPGCYNIQLIKTMDSVVKPFEINPSISTTACLGLAAGVDFISIFLGSPEALGSLEQGLVSFKERLGLRRSWYNEIVEPAVS
jgi:carbamoyl-phosphate synthase large subunit